MQEPSSSHEVFSKKMGLSVDLTKPSNTKRALGLQEVLGIVPWLTGPPRQNSCHVVIMEALFQHTEGARRPQKISLVKAVAHNILQVGPLKKQKITTKSLFLTVLYIPN